MLVHNLFFLSYLSLQLIGWSTFAGTSFEWVYVEKEGAEVQIPHFPAKVKQLEGKEIELSGHFLPFEIGTNSIILSQFPYASCFFCGGTAGAESVAEIQFPHSPPNFKLDQIVHVKGKLKLNERDLDHLTFILTDARIVK
ncbi:MAG: DUF3299 domain-containing protein [Bacteroidota bacterium]